MPNFDRPRLTHALTEGTEALRLFLSERQITKLIDFVALLVKWNHAYNLTAVRDPMQMVSHHLLDSLAVVSAFANTREVLDVGSGGGLPGIVFAIWAQESQPQMRISMIDTIGKKTAFLTQVKAELELGNVTVHTGRVEELRTTHRFDVITSRAFASLTDFVKWSGHLLSEQGRFIAMKGTIPHEEIEQLPHEWKATRIEPVTVPGLGAERHLIVMERQIQ
jgi:16S rRNA (guanine527-N7)-methyltransferase